MSTRRYALAALLATLPAFAIFAQDQADADTRPTIEVTIGQKGSEQDPLAGRDASLAVEPQRDPAVHQVEGILGVPALSVAIDPRTLGVAPGDPLPNLRREGEAIRKRDGRLLPTADRGYAVFILDPNTEAGETQPLAMVLAPCMALEAMERMQEDRGERLRFTLTGEVHAYRGVNYLLPTAQPKPWLIAEETEVTPPAGEALDTASEAQPGTADAGTTTDPKADNPSDKPDDDAATPTADEVLAELLRQRDSLSNKTASDKNDAQPLQLDAPIAEGMLTDPLLLGLDPDRPQAELKIEGDFLIARTGRLIRTSDGAHALFVLDADQQGAPEPPLIMQACKLLETMEKTVREQGDDIPFVITGQVFVYRGANYLLPTIVKREFDRGNLK